MNKRLYKLLSILSTTFCLFALWLSVSCSALAQSQTEAQTSDGRCSEPIPTIFQRVSPSVVFITASSINPYRVTDRIEHIVGTGFIIDTSGLILTNSHVAFNRQSLIVTLDDGTSLPAQIVGADPIFDIALVRIPKPSQGVLPVVALGDSDHLKVGEDVLAIGNPLGLDQTLTRGVISAMNRILPETFFSLQEPLIQMDAPINPGNSGGPLLNRCGQVIGVTTSMIPNAANIGFSIPINQAKALIPALIKQGHVIRPWIGFHGQYVDSDLQSLLRIPLVEGFMIEVVEPNSPAEKMSLHGGQLEMTIAGRDFLIGGDIITAINGVATTQPEKMFDALQGLKVGDTLKLTLFRDGKYLDIKYVLPERPLLPGDIPGEPVGEPLMEVSPARSTLRPKASRRL